MPEFELSGLAGLDLSLPGAERADELSVEEWAGFTQGWNSIEKALVFIMVRLSNKNEQERDEQTQELLETRDTLQTDSEGMRLLEFGSWLGSLSNEVLEKIIQSFSL